jgi:hypothetical protein
MSDGFHRGRSGVTITSLLPFLCSTALGENVAMIAAFATEYRYLGRWRRGRRRMQDKGTRSHRVLCICLHIGFLGDRGFAREIALFSAVL